MVRGFLGGENHFLLFSSMSLTELKNISKNFFLKSSLEFVSTHFQANETIKNLVVRNFSKSLKSD